VRTASDLAPPRGSTSGAPNPGRHPGRQDLADRTYLMGKKNRGICFSKTKIFVLEKIMIELENLFWKFPFLLFWIGSAFLRAYSAKILNRILTISECMLRDVSEAALNLLAPLES
jgi:hypothetical protein